ncbi:MAG: nudix hydrolase [Ignavibacteria bacterium]|nr:MAG: nudix hydrolase [Ignavibacteria bacterium]KAF0161877.1 MAG: nudix hydrolase [Ignavibacteria bacterium]
MNYEILKSETPFKGKVVDIRVDEVKFEGKEKTVCRETVIHPGGAVIVPVKDDGTIVLIKQFRWPHKKVLFELPAGKLDKGEEPQICASRELKEETGYSASNISRLGEIITTSGFCNEVLHIYLANGLVFGDHAREEGEEGIELVELTLNEIDEKIRTNEICDAKTICGIQMYRLRI